MPSGSIAFRVVSRRARRDHDPRVTRGITVECRASCAVGAVLCRTVALAKGARVERAVTSEFPPLPRAAAAATGDPVLAALERIERRIAEVERVTGALAPLVDAAPG